jgi:hypothetical protein
MAWPPHAFLTQSGPSAHPINRTHSRRSRHTHAASASGEREAEQDRSGASARETGSRRHFPTPWQLHNVGRPCARRRPWLSCFSSSYPSVRPWLPGHDLRFILLPFLVTCLLNIRVCFDDSEKGERRRRPAALRSGRRRWSSTSRSSTPTTTASSPTPRQKQVTKWPWITHLPRLPSIPRSPAEKVSLFWHLYYISVICRVLILSVVMGGCRAS